MLVPTRGGLFYFTFALWLWRPLWGILSWCKDGLSVAATETIWVFSLLPSAFSIVHHWLSFSLKILYTIWSVWNSIALKLFLSNVINFGDELGFHKFLLFLEEITRSSVYFRITRAFLKKTRHRTTKYGCVYNVLRIWIWVLKISKSWNSTTNTLLNPLVLFLHKCHMFVFKLYHNLIPSYTLWRSLCM